jgi:hypothetical protein
MMITVDERYLVPFQNLLAERGIGEPTVFADVEYFEEEPVFLYYSQLDFLSDLWFPDANRVLIRATALHLARIVASVSYIPAEHGKTILRMVSVTGWEGDPSDGQTNYEGCSGFLAPYIWCANLSDPRRSEFRLWPVSSTAGAFVKEAIGGDERFSVVEGPPDKFGALVPERVYIYMKGSEGTDHLIPKRKNGS